MPKIPSRSQYTSGESDWDLRFDGFSAPPAGAEHEVLTPRLTHTHHLAAGSQTAVLAGALGNSLTTQEYKENKEKEI